MPWPPGYVHGEEAQPPRGCWLLADVRGRVRVGSGDARGAFELSTRVTVRPYVVRDREGASRSVKGVTTMGQPVANRAARLTDPSGRPC
ncbi:hypothetical protein GCM10010277_38860 [Streptomyces longisporoflavus]|nr:hypothetical protein GCM10010277_38860 [Streptomyces longisporoflavus]